MVTLEKKRQTSKNKNSNKYAVIMYNDDYTSMEFVVMVLVKEFNYGLMSAVNLMLQIHHSDKKTVAIYPMKLAYAKRDKVLNIANECGFNRFKVEVEKA